MKITKAMILCAGFGKRLRPLTFSSPKPLLKIGDQTLLSNTLHMLEQYGVKKAVINIHYLGNYIVHSYCFSQTLIRKPYNAVSLLPFLLIQHRLY